MKGPPAWKPNLWGGSRGFVKHKETAYLRNPPLGGHNLIYRGICFNTYTPQWSISVAKFSTLSDLESPSCKARTPEFNDAQLVGRGAKHKQNHFSPGPIDRFSGKLRTTKNNPLRLRSPTLTRTIDPNKETPEGKGEHCSLEETIKSCKVLVVLWSSKSA